MRLGIVAATGLKSGIGMNARRLGTAAFSLTGGTDYYAGGSGSTSPYTSSFVDNRPTGTDIVALSRAGTQTLTFTQTIANPVIAFVSLNGNGYAFDQDFELLSLGGVDGNACGFWGCGGATVIAVQLVLELAAAQIDDEAARQAGRPAPG